jgi:hypothetical protein
MKLTEFRKKILHFHCSDSLQTDKGRLQHDVTYVGTCKATAIIQTNYIELQPLINTSMWRIA